MDIQYFEGEDSKEYRLVLDNLRAYNRSKVGDSNKRPFTLAMRDSQGELMGGLNGLVYWNWLFIDHLWVAELKRGKDIGTRLMNEAEAHARETGCHAIHLDTFGFQALSFYQKLGYSQFGELPDCPSGYSRHYLWKKLT